MKTSQSLTASNIISKVYNSIKAPSKPPKCSVCSNQEIQRQLEEIEGRNYVYIPDRHVEIYLCNFCQKLDQPKCKHCFNRQPCCTQKERVEFMDYFNNLKKQIIKTVTSVSTTYKNYEDRSMKDLTFPQTSYISPSSINKQLTIYLNDVQYKLKKQIEEKIAFNQEQLFQVYKDFQRQIISRLYPYSPEGIQRYKIDMGENITKNMSLEDCIKFLNNVEKYKENMENMGKEICDSYIQKVNIEYPKTLYYRLNEAFRQFLVPKLSYKDALIQTIDTKSPSGGSYNSIHSQKSIKQNQLSQKNAAAVMIQQKVQGLQRVITKNLQTIKRLQQRIKDLEFVVQIQQSRNQDYQLKIIELETKLGRSNLLDKSILDKDNSQISRDREIYSRITYKSQISRNGLKSSKSDPNLLKSIELASQEEQNNYRQKQQNEQNNKIREGQNMYVEQKSIIKKHPQEKRPRKPSQNKMKSQLKGSWLEEVVNELDK